MSARYLLVFRKDGAARFLSHLDLQATLEYGMRRAGLPIDLSEGFNPRPRFSLVAALPLGYIGERELLEVTLREEIPVEEVVERMQGAVPSGIRFLSGSVVAQRSAPTAARLEEAVYRVQVESAPEGLEERARTLLARERIEVEEEREGKVRRRDIRPLIVSVEAIGNGEVRLVTKLTVEGSVRPEEVLRQMGIGPEGAVVSREEVRLRGERA
jgi:radical SAM-linked protein